jgi:hypothetical protein
VFSRVQVFPDSVAAQHVRLPDADEPVVYEMTRAQMQDAIAALAG